MHHTAQFLDDYKTAATTDHDEMLAEGPFSSEDFQGNGYENEVDLGGGNFQFTYNDIPCILVDCTEKPEDPTYMFIADVGDGDLDHLKNEFVEDFFGPQPHGHIITETLIDMKKPEYREGYELPSVVVDILNK